MMQNRAKACSICGTPNPADSHHVAARRNDQNFLVDLCKSCHRLVTAWQYGHRIPLNEDENREGLIKPWSMATGAGHIFEALAASLGDAAKSDAFMEMGKILALFPVSEGMFRGPREKGPKLRRDRFEYFNTAGTVDVIGVAANILVYLSSKALGNDDSITKLFSGIASNPKGFVNWWDSQDEGMYGWLSNVGESLEDMFSEIEDSSSLISAGLQIRKYLDEFSKMFSDYLEGLK